MWALYRHVIYRWKAIDLSILMTLIYPARYLPIDTHSLKFPVANVSRFTVYCGYKSWPQISQQMYSRLQIS